jgi:hypothetical protein
MSPGVINVLIVVTLILVLLLLIQGLGVFGC